MQFPDGATKTLTLLLMIIGDGFRTKISLPAHVAFAIFIAGESDRIKQSLWQRSAPSSATHVHIPQDRHIPDAQGGKMMVTEGCMI